jgi:putative ABC transport system permease protein
LQNAADQSPVRSAFPVELIAQLGQKKLLEMRVGALRDAYLDPDLLPTVSPLHGDKRAVLGLAVVAALILLMAAANYVNLTIVRTLRRKREIALRKVLGASAQSIVQQFLAESILASLFAAALGSLIATLLLPLFSDLVNRKLDQVFTPTSYLAFGALGIVVGAMAGAYPAWVALQVDIGRALSGRSDSEATGGVWLRRALTVLQFSTAIALTGLALTISWQTRYASTLFPGFDPAPLLVVDLPETLQDPVSRVFRDEALHLPDVSAVTAATSAIGRPDWKTFAIVQRSDAKPTSVEFKGVSNNFFTTHHVSPVAGRLFDERIDPQESASVVVMNAAATNALGFDSPQAALGQFINPPVKGSNFARLSGQAARSSPLQIVGIVPDIRYQNLREPVPALVYVITPLTKVLTVRSRGDASAVKTALEALWQRNFPNNVPKIARAGSFFELNYADDLRLARMLAAAACVAIGIAAFGIYVLSAHSARRRSKEVVLRKLYGANQVAIARLMARELLMLLALGAVGGLPLVAIGGERFLASFVEHASIIPLAMLYALFMAIAVALVATCRHTLIAMRTSPSNVLRY